MIAPQIVCVCRASFASAVAEGRFELGVVQEGQLLMEADPIVRAVGERHWTPVGTADEATAQLISGLGRLATFRDLGPRLGPLPTTQPPEIEPVAEAVEAPVRPGPQPITTREEVEAERRRLVEEGKPAGERSIAKALGVGRDAVRYALGKDRHS
jgi:hypothetical protein